MVKPLLDERVRENIVIHGQVSKHNIPYQKVAHFKVAQNRKWHNLIGVIKVFGATLNMRQFVSSYLPCLN